MASQYHPYRLSTGYDLFDPIDGKEIDKGMVLRESRKSIVEKIQKLKHCDIVIVGGGIHGASLARLAAFNGLKTVLIERDDYASGTSSKSSKMAHGGLRYLELFDFAQVFEGIRCREDLFKTAPHLVAPYRFAIPLFEGQSWLKRKLGMGLWVYDLMARKRAYKHQWTTALESTDTLFEASRRPHGYYLYTDGIMNDTRLVLENIFSARREGALCLNRAQLISFHHRDHGPVEVSWRDECSGEKQQLFAGIVVNCAGPWVASAGRLTPSALSGQIKLSRGTHLLFNKVWDAPPLFLPMPGKSRYYWIWPHFAGTLVGTTEVDVNEPEADPMPSSAEVDEILDRLKRDVPESGLTRSCLHYAYAGIRTLPLRKKDAESSVQSRRHAWSYAAGLLSLIGGKFTTAAATAEEGLQKVYALSGLHTKVASLRQKKYPGALRLNEEIESFYKSCDEVGVSRELAQLVTRRLGSRVQYLKEFKDWHKALGKIGLSGEIDFALEYEQAESLEDLMRRRLELEYYPGNGVDLLSDVIRRLKKLRPEVDWESQEQAYRKRIESIRQLLGSCS